MHTGYSKGRSIEGFVPELFWVEKGEIEATQKKALLIDQSISLHGKHTGRPISICKKGVVHLIEMVMHVKCSFESK